MNFKTTLILAVLLVAVGLYFWIDRGAMTTDQLQQQTALKGDNHTTPLFADGTFTSDAVSKISIEQNGKTIMLAKVNKNWQQTAPVHFALNDWSARQIADDATGLHYIEKFMPGQNHEPNKKAAGFSPAQATITFTTGKTTQTVILGQRILGGHGYVMVNDDPHIYVVSDDLHKAILDGGIHDWRRKSLKSPPMTQLLAVHLKRESDPAVDAHRIHSQWFLGQAQQQRANESDVKKLVEAVNSATIDHFISDESSALTAYGLTHPQLQLTLVAAAPGSTDTGSTDTKATTQPATLPEAAKPTKIYTLRVGAPADLDKKDYFATWSVGKDISPVVFTLKATDIKPLHITANDLRDPHVFTTKADDVREFTLTRPGQPNLHIIKGPTAGYIFGKPAPKFGVDYNTAGNLISKLTKAQAKAYRADFKPSAAPIATITLGLQASNLTETVRFYHGPDDNDLALHQGETVAYQVPKSDLALLTATRLTLRDKDVLNLPAKDITNVRLEQHEPAKNIDAKYTFSREAQRSASAPGSAPGNATQPARTTQSAPTTQSATRSDAALPRSTWHLQNHKTFESDAFQALLRDLAPLRIEHWLTTPAKSVKGNLTLTVERIKGSPIVLTVNAANRHATLTGIDHAFVLPQATVDQLAAEYRDRTIIPVSSDDIQKVTVLTSPVLLKKLTATQPAGLTITRDDTETYVASNSKTLDQSAVGKLFDTLAGLQVEHINSITIPATGPVSWEMSDPMRTITVTTKKGYEYSFSFPTSKDAVPQAIAGPSKGVGMFGLFTLREADMNALRANLIKPATK